MKKKTVKKKLVLAKETVLKLEDGLKSVQGGKPPYSDYYSGCDLCGNSEVCEGGW
jgi:hypothetical protein